MVHCFTYFNFLHTCTCSCILVTSTLNLMQLGIWHESQLSPNQNAVTSALSLICICYITPYWLPQDPSFLQITIQGLTSTVVCNSIAQAHCLVFLSLLCSPAHPLTLALFNVLYMSRDYVSPIDRPLNGKKLHETAIKSYLNVTFKRNLLFFRSIAIFYYNPHLPTLNMCNYTLRWYLSEVQVLD